MKFKVSKEDYKKAIHYLKLNGKNIPRNSFEVLMEANSLYEYMNREFEGEIREINIHHPDMDTHHDVYSEDDQEITEEQKEEVNKMKSKTYDFLDFDVEGDFFVFAKEKGLVSKPSSKEYKNTLNTDKFYDMEYKKVDIDEEKLKELKNKDYQNFIETKDYDDIINLYKRLEAMRQDVNSMIDNTKDHIDYFVKNYEIQKK